jgi:hypothetical protein
MPKKLTKTANPPSPGPAGSAPLSEYAVSVVMSKGPEILLFMTVAGAESEVEALRLVMSHCSNTYPGWALTKCCGTYELLPNDRGQARREQPRT